MKKILTFSALAAILTALIIWIVWGNTVLELTTYTIGSSRLPKSFNGYRIAHVSDLHNVEIGKGNRDLLAMLTEAQPDMVAVTGDLIDSRHTDIAVALNFIREAVKIAPVYYVTGNHEDRIESYEELKSGMEAAGVILLEDRRTEIRLNGETITLIGIHDPNFHTTYFLGSEAAVIDANLEPLLTDNGSYTILLSHRPELFDTYAAREIDLVLTGHAHGGQFRLPVIGGLYAPHQGLFPKYDDGLYTEGRTSMLVSRGIGNSIFPFRINNHPEVVLIELRADS